MEAIELKSFALPNVNNRRSNYDYEYNSGYPASAKERIVAQAFIICPIRYRVAVDMIGRLEQMTGDIDTSRASYWTSD